LRATSCAQSKLSKLSSPGFSIRHLISHFAKSGKNFANLVSEITLLSVS
jgi:hypothetical protein